MSKEPTQYEIDSHKWRKNSESKSPDYCGSCSLELHTEQVRDPDSWVSEHMINIWRAEWIKDHAPTEIESIKTHTKELEAQLAECEVAIKELALEATTAEDQLELAEMKLAEVAE